MNDKLKFSVADHLFSIETSDRVLNTKMMSNYVPFHVRNDVHRDFLFNLKGNEKVHLPDIPSDDILELNGAKYKIYNTPDGVVVSVKQDDKEHRFFASSDWREIVSDLTFIDEREVTFLNSFLRIAFGMSSIQRYKTIKIHASVTELNGKALVFLGKSGTGKSTHSRLWRESVPGCTLLNDDEPLVRVFENKVQVYGAPWSGSTPCYRNESAEVVAFVHLYQSPENKLTKLKNVEALTSLYTSAAMLRSDLNNKDKVLDVVAEILLQIPVYRLDCRPDYEAVTLTRALLPV